MITASQFDDDAIIAQAMNILKKRMREPGLVCREPAAAASYLKLKTASLEHEVFNVMFLDVKNRVITTEEMFRGTLTSTSVYPREVVKKAMHHNANGVVISHNHPSGEPEPSDADMHVTDHLQQALALVGVRVLDHIIVAGDRHYSFAEHGRI
jgi:DNA repair protein RadC